MNRQATAVANYTTRMVTPDRQKGLTGLDEASEGFKLFLELDVLPGDVPAKKIKYSAFIPGSSDIDARLKARDIDTDHWQAANVCFVQCVSATA